MGRSETRLPMMERLALRVAAEALELMHNEERASFHLDLIAPALQGQPEVLAVRKAIWESLRQRWQRGLGLAQRHIRGNPLDPKGWLYLAYCERRGRRLPANPPGLGAV